jgi:hypothetical protein
MRRTGTELVLEHLRRHDLRHTGQTWMADAGVPVHILRKIAGHGSLTTTQRYLHPDAQSIQAAGESLTAYLKAAVHKRSTTPSDLDRNAARPRLRRTPFTWTYPRRRGFSGWSGRRDLNPRPLDPQECAGQSCAR